VLQTTSLRQLVRRFFTHPLLPFGFSTTSCGVSSDDIGYLHLLILLVDTDKGFSVLGYFKWFLAIEVFLLGFASS
jgi:hypothetical protein